MRTLAITCLVTFFVGCPGPKSPSDAGARPLALGEPHDCCEGGCSSEKGTAPVSSDAGLVCPSGSVPVADCGRSHCAPAPCTGSAPTCCSGSCSGDSVIATCLANEWSCAGGTVPASSCGGNCTPPSCTGVRPACCHSCDGDTGASAVCAEGSWACPMGTVGASQCPPTNRPFCTKPYPDAG